MAHLSTLHVSNPHNQLTEDDRYTYAYDLKGKRTSRTAKATGDVETYTYDSQNRLVGYASPTVTARYAYDALDRRVAKTVGAAQTAYVYDMSPEDPLAHDDIVMEWDTGGTPTLTRRWLHSTSVDEPVGFEDYTSTSGVGSGAERTMFADRQGSVIWVTETATGSVVAAYEYDGYGQITQTQGTLAQPYGYTGREYDAESGLYHYRARSYDAAAGVFVQSDPIGFESGQKNIYSYTLQDPFTFSDPTGLSSLTIRQRVGASGAHTLSSVTLVGEGALRTAGLLARMLSGIEFSSAAKIYTQTLPNNSSGTCVPKMERALRRFVDHHAERCVFGLPPEENLRRMRVLAATVVARVAIAETCFAGGDYGHNLQIEIRKKDLRLCHGILTRSWKKGK